MFVCGGHGRNGSDIGLWTHMGCRIFEQDKTLAELRAILWIADRAKKLKKLESFYATKVCCMRSTRSDSSPEKYEKYSRC